MVAIPAPQPLLVQGLIAAGEFSSVFLCCKTSGTDLTAVKCFSRARISAEERLGRKAQNEQHILSLVSQLPHPFVVNFRFTLSDNDYLCLGMEHVGGCDMFTLLQNKGSLSRDITRIYAAEVGLALGHIHSFDIIFRDLKPENVLIGLDGHTKLTDFGSALKMSGRQGAEPPPAGIVSLGGTPEYMSPEMLLGLPTCEVSDWWAFACLVCEMLTGSSPFVVASQSINNSTISQSIQGLMERIIHGPVDVPEHRNIGASELSLLEVLLVRDPRDRLGARPDGHSAVLAHEFFQGILADILLLKQYPAPWLPHLDGPISGLAGVPEAGEEALRSAEASTHAQGALVDATDEAVEAQLAAQLALAPVLLWPHRRSG